jgi:gamma-glutamylcyclotransferase
MSASAFLYFAYGSNMLSARLQALERCPSARTLGVAEFRGHDLHWHKLSRKDGSGKCDVVASALPGTAALGVLYEIAESERPALDREEGLNKGYDAIEAGVLFKGVPTVARSYKATEKDTALRPYTWYRALVVAGAKEHGLPADYIARLEAVPADQDPDQKRHDENMALIGKVRA